MKTLKESILDKTNIKIKSVKKSIDSLGSVFSLEKIKILPTFSTSYYLDCLNGKELSSIVEGKKFLTQELESKVLGLKGVLPPDRYNKLTDFFLWLDNVDVADLGGKLNPDSLIDILSANVLAYDIIYKYKTTHKYKGMCFRHTENSNKECMIQLQDGGIRLCEITVRER